METSTQHPDGEDSTGVHYDSLQCGNLQTGKYASRMYTSGRLETAALSPISGSIFGMQDNTHNPEAEQDFIGQSYSLNGIPGLIGNFGCTSSSSNNFSQSISNFNEWSGGLSSIWFSNTGSNVPSTIDTSGCFYPNVPRTSPQLDLLGQRIDIFADTGSSSLVNHRLWAPNPDSYLMQSEDDHRDAVNNEFVKKYTSIRQRATQSHPESVTMPTVDSITGVPAPNIHLLSSYESLPLHSEVDGDLDLFSIGINDPSSPLTGQHLPDPNLHVLYSSNRDKRQFGLAFDEANYNETVTLAKGPSQQRRLEAKSACISDVAGAAMDKKMIVFDRKKLPKKGPLPGEQREKKAKMRKKMACAKCFASRQACSFEDPCTRCATLTPSPFSEISCNRGHLRLQFDVFSSPFLNGHLTSEAIKRESDSLEYISSEFEIYVSTGSSHPTINIWACEFILKTGNSVNNLPRAFANYQSLNYGVPKRNADQLKLLVSEHIKAISSFSIVIENSQTLSGKVLNAIFQFQQRDAFAGQNGLLAIALEVNRLHYVLGRMIVLSQRMVLNADEYLQDVAVDLPSPPLRVACIVSKQLRGEMVSLLESKTKELLDSCAELIQIQVTGFIVHRSSFDSGNQETIRRCGIEVCRRIENKFLEHSWQLLVGKMRGRFKKHNPFKSEYQSLMNENEGVEGGVAGQAELNLIKSIREIMVSDAEEITKKSSISHDGGASRTIEDVENFQRHNSGRLLSKYLRKLEKGEKD